MKTPPRLRILVLGDGQDSPPISHFLARLADRGHRIVPERHVRGASEADLIVLTPASGELVSLVNRVAPMVRPQHIVIHTQSRCGLGVLEDLHHRGAIIGRLSHLAAELWSIEGGNELGETILELLVLESGGKVAKDDPEGESPETRFLFALREQSQQDLRRIAYVLSPPQEHPETSPDSSPPVPFSRELPDLSEIKQLYQRLTEQEDPSFLRYVLFLIRRIAEEQSRHEVELWVLGEEAKMNH